MRLLLNKQPYYRFFFSIQLEREIRDAEILIQKKLEIWKAQSIEKELAFEKEMLHQNDDKSLLSQVVFLSVYYSFLGTKPNIQLTQAHLKKKFDFFRIIPYQESIILLNTHCKNRDFNILKRQTFGKIWDKHFFKHFWGKSSRLASI